MTELSVACKLTQSDLRARQAGILDHLRSLAKIMKELESGYAFQFVAEDGLLLQLAEMIEQERKCCPFLQFKLLVECATGPIWLDITGPEGTKTFLHEVLQLA
jgi:hypothetical protein